MSLVATIAQQIISPHLALERSDREDGDASDASTARGAFQSARSPYSSSTTTTIARGSLKRTLSEGQSGSHYSRAGTPAEGTDEPRTMDGAGVVRPLMLIQLLTWMRENRLSDLAHATGRPVVVDKRLERTQAAG